LEQEEGIVVVGEASGAESALAHIAQTCPDIVLLDWSLQGAAANGLLYVLRQTCSHLRVIVLSGQPAVEDDALAAGAEAFVSKADPPERLLAALRLVQS
jgi:DNA-binding NarL/FixJ family response regulator